MSVKVSVIIPAYNAEKTITRTILSVISQTMDDIEIIVIINGTTDNTYEISRKTLTNQTRFSWNIILEEEGNVGKARNIGIENAEGEFLFFLDADDYIENNALEKLYTAAKGKSADLVFCGYRKEKEKGEVIFQYTELFDYYKDTENGVKVLQDFLIGTIWICIISVLFSRQIAIQNDIRFSEKYSSGEDQCFIMHFLYYSKIVFSYNEILSIYFAHSLGLSSSKKVFESIYLFEDFIEFLKKNPSSIEENITEKIIKLIRNYKIPYLFGRSFYRFAKDKTYADFKKLKKSKEALLRKYKLKISPKNRHSKFGVYGYFLLRYIPVLFYCFSKVCKY